MAGVGSVTKGVTDFFGCTKASNAQERTDESTGLLGTKKSEKLQAVGSHLGVTLFVVGLLATVALFLIYFRQFDLVHKTAGALSPQIALYTGIGTAIVTATIAALTAIGLYKVHCAKATVDQPSGERERAEEGEGLIGRGGEERTGRRGEVGGAGRSQGGAAGTGNAEGAGETERSEEEEEEEEAEGAEGGGDARQPQSAAAAQSNTGAAAGGNQQG